MGSIHSVPDNAHFLLRNALADDIQDEITLGDILIGCKGVYKGLFPDDNNVQSFPAIFCTIEGETEALTGAASESEQWEYPVRVWIAERMSRFTGIGADDEFLFKWRKQLLKRFNRQRGALGGNLSAYPWLRACIVSPQTICDPRLPHYQYLASGLVFRFTTSEPRIF